MEPGPSISVSQPFLRGDFQASDGFGPARMAALFGSREQLFAVTVVVLLIKPAGFYGRE